jgi:long-subunit acyl-CoA synthetase (AMP-forming)
LPRDFSISGGELGPTRKVKRHAVELKYNKEIEEMYAVTDRTSLWDT